MKDAFFVQKRKPRTGSGKKLTNPTAKTKQASSGVGRSKKRSAASFDDDRNGADETGGESDAGEAGDADDMDLVGDRDHALKTVDSDEELREEARETAAQRRLRLAKKYIDKIKTEETEQLAPTDFDAEDIDNDLIAERLRDDVLEAKGKAYFKVAGKLSKLDPLADGRVRSFGGKKVHQLALTCVDVVDEEAASNAGGIFIYTSSKDGHIVKWDFKSGKKMHEFRAGRKHTKKAIKAFGDVKLKKHIGHRDQVLTLAVSGDGKFLASGGRDKTIQIWSILENKHLATFTQHRDAVSGLAFRCSTRSNQLYSCSYDRTIKLWNVDELSYIETLFGHQDRIEHVDSMALERCLTAGARDKTVRLWKIVEESQLIFRGGGGGMSGGDLRTDVLEGLVLASEVEQAKKEAKRQGADKFGTVIDVVAMLDEEHFVSGTDNGAISLWTATKKKPIFTKPEAHGPVPTRPENDTVSAAPCHWITALAVVRYSDLFASGSCDGFVRLWQVSGDKKYFSPVLAVPIMGFVNSLRFFKAPLLEAGGEETMADVETERQVEGVDSLNVGMAKKRALARKAVADKASKPKDVLYLAVATGQEHRLGRWWRCKDARNQLKVITLG
ncbi:WD40-repeat-containing domain protein [Chytriomyces sp. MP71]|nr:WD40-repeat-containing domain protein [Chytriomyces sp. MP71]